MQERTIGKALAGDRIAEPPMADLWSWLMKKRWFLSHGKGTREIGADGGRRFSVLALVLIFAVTKSWSVVVHEAISQSDAVRYYHFLQNGSWLHRYFLEQTMFWIMTAAHPTTFSSYLFISSSIPLCILLFAFYRLNYTRTDQFLLIFFFSCSFYGVHFVVTFQRQFYALALFILALSSPGRGIFTRSASLFAHLYSVVLHLYWQLRRLSTQTLVLIALPVILIGFFTMQQIVSTKFERYAAGGEASASALALKEGLNIIYALIVLRTVKRGHNAVRGIAVAFILFAVPALFWPAYAGIFVRFDYYFFPLIIAVWPIALRRQNRTLFRLTLLASTISGFVLWMVLNFEWIVLGVKGRLL